MIEVLSLDELGKKALLDEAVGVVVQAYNADYVVDNAYVHTDTNYTAVDKAKVDALDTAEVW